MGDAVDKMIEYAAKALAKHRVPNSEWDAWSDWWKQLFRKQADVAFETLKIPLEKLASLQERECGCGQSELTTAQALDYSFEEIHGVRCSKCHGTGKIPSSHVVFPVEFIGSAQAMNGLVKTALQNKGYSWHEITDAERCLTRSEDMIKAAQEQSDGDKG